MEKAGTKTRDLRFFSEKNGQMVCVHSKLAREYTRWLESQSWVETYECNVALDIERYQHVSPVDIRKSTSLCSGAATSCSTTPMGGRRCGKS